MSRAKRYETEGKLNYQKVFAVAIAIAVVIMFIFIVKNVLKEREKITKEYEYFALYTANDINEETGVYQTKVLNSKNKEILTGYDQVEALENIDENDKKWMKKEWLF